MNKLKLSLISTALFMSQALAAGNPEPILYGTITKTNGEAVTGSIQWGNQETFLSDIYNGTKLKTTGIEHLTDDEKDDLLDHQPGPQANIGDLQITFKSIFGKDIDPPYFNVNFGAIKSIQWDQDIVTARLHDGSIIISDDNDNDTGTDINVKNNEGEITEVDHDELKLIEFSAAPDDAKTFGDGIYGTVESSIGTFSGRIMWDKDERLTSEKLDGSDASKEHNIRFYDIKSIEKIDDGSTSKVVLVSGEELNLRGTNDVNNGNRGIWLDNPEYGRIEISWSQFEKLTIEEVDVKWMTIDDYVQAAKSLSGVVTLKDGSELPAQQIVFDMNQESNTELLYADIGGNNRQVPLFHIHHMSKNENQSLVLKLKDGQEVLALNSNSVTALNNGVLVSNDNNHKWYTWNDVQAIAFD